MRIGTRQDHYVGMREFSNHAVLSMSDTTMALSSKYTQDLSVQIVFFTFSSKWFLCVYFWAVIGDILLTCLLLCMSLRQLARAHYYKARIIGARALKTLWRHLKLFLTIDLNSDFSNQFTLALEVKKIGIPLYFAQINLIKWDNGAT